MPDSAGLVSQEAPQGRGDRGPLNSITQSCQAIHDPKEKYLLVRQRIDGLLQEVFKVPKHLQDATVSRLKIISGMDIADHRRSQDGRSQLRFEGKRIDLRVSTLPTQYGEKVVVRLLDQTRAQMTMDQIDLTPDNLRVWQALLLRPRE
jgi:type IV pilus assembly protein PilB